MKSTRLFVGGLGDGVDENMLVSKLASYGSVVNAEVKEKTDADGNVTQRFAYVNIQAAQEELEQCIRSLNGSSWQGSCMRVEVAKESFLERLKREREERQGHRQVTNSFTRYDGGQKAERYHEDKVDTHKKEYEVIPNEKRKRRNFELDPSFAHKNFNKSLGPDGNDNDLPPAKRKSIGKKRNEKEEEMMASFKTFSSFWADSDEEEGRVLSNKEKRKLEEAMSKRKEDISGDESEESDSDGLEAFEDAPSEEEEDEAEKEEKSTKSADKRQNWGAPKVVNSTKKEVDPSFKPMTRYDPTLQDHLQFNLQPKAPEVTKEVESSEQEKSDVSAGLALAALFKDSKPDSKGDEESPAEEGVKRQPFFLSATDERIQEGFDWMLENVQEKILPKFKAVEDDLYDVIKTRYNRAKREMDKKYQKERDRRYLEKRGIFKSANAPIFEDQIYDHGWRLSEVLNNEKKRGGQNNSRDEENNYQSSQRGRSNYGRGQRGRHYSPRGRGASGQEQFKGNTSGDWRNHGHQRGRGGFNQNKTKRDIQSAWFGKNTSQGSNQDSVPSEA